ncbi:MAG: TIR domain-containing protein [bacterium]|nr:TIR domain-containing protein [bacterium]
MNGKHVFISYSQKDVGLVEELRQKLQLNSIETWTDTRRLTVGDVLAPEIQTAIQEAGAFLVEDPPPAN